MLNILFKNRHLLVTVLFLLLPIFIYSCANWLVYFPNQVVCRTPVPKNLEYEDISFRSEDNTKLHGWFLPSAGKPLGTVIHFHGNAQNILSHVFFVSWLPKENFNVFVFDYRGYGESEGSPTRKGVYNDCIAAIKYIKTRKDVDQNKLFILGQSLGGANAISVLSKNKFSGIRAIAIESTFYSYRSIARDKIGNIPFIQMLKWPLCFFIISNTYSPGKVVDQLTSVPLLFIHGTHDKTIPFHHSQWLYERANKPKYLWAVDGGRHTEAFTKFGEYYKKKLVQFFIEAISK